MSGLTNVEVAKKADKSIEDIFKSYATEKPQNAQQQDIPQFYQLLVKGPVRKAESQNRQTLFNIAQPLKQIENAGYSPPNDKKLLFVQKKDSELQPSKITIVGYLS